MRVYFELEPATGQLDTTVRDQTGMPVGAITHMSTQRAYGGLHTVSLVINMLDTVTVAPALQPVLGKVFDNSQETALNQHRRLNL